MDVYAAAIEFARPGASLAELDRTIRDGLAGIGYPGQPSHPVCHGVGARAHEPPYAHQAGGGTIEAGMVLAIEPGVYWPEGGGLRVEDNFLITETGSESPVPLPGRDRQAGMIDRDRIWMGDLQPARARAPIARHGRALRHDAARRGADRRRRAVPGRQARDRACPRRRRRRPDRSRLRARLGGRRGGNPADRRNRARAEVWGFARAVQADVEQLAELGVRAAVIESPIGREAGGPRRLARGHARTDPQGGLVRRRRGDHGRILWGRRLARRARLFPARLRGRGRGGCEGGGRRRHDRDRHPGRRGVPRRPDRRLARRARPLARPRRLRARHRGRRRGGAGRRVVGAGNRERDGGARGQREPRGGRAHAGGALRDPDAARPRKGT